MAESSEGRGSGIEVEGLIREFKNGPRAVDGIDLRVAQGEIYGFLGPNGAGKSTTVLMLTTLLPPTAGTARVAGFDVVKEGPQVRASIGAALQEAALDPLLTGREHMRLQTALHGLGKGEREERGKELLQRVGLIDAADRKVGGYSGGMKRRLDLALALAHRPRILFLDEPTTGLDIQSRTALWDEVARLASDEGVTVFLTTQYLEEADALAGRVGIIDHGKIVPELIFPLFLLAVNSGGLKDATNLPGFPTDSYLTFALAVPFMQGALFSVMNSGTDLARDIETGFLNRLALTPLRGTALLSGLLAGTIVLGLLQGVTYLTVGLIAGAELAAGPGGALVIIALAVSITVAFGTIGLFAALRTGTGEAIQGLFPVFFVFLFLSSMALPLELIQTDWYR